MENVVLSIAVLIIKGNKVLLVKHKDGAQHLTGTYGLPGGRLNEGEDEITASVREISEETGLETTKEDLKEFPNNFYYATIERKNGSFLKFSWKVFLCQRYKGELKESDETFPEWVGIDMLDSLNLLPNIKEAVKAGLEYLKKS